MRTSILLFVLGFVLLVGGLLTYFFVGVSDDAPEPVLPVLDTVSDATLLSALLASGTREFRTLDEVRDELPTELRVPVRNAKSSGRAFASMPAEAGVPPFSLADDGAPLPDWLEAHVIESDGTLAAIAKPGSAGRSHTVTVLDSTGKFVVPVRVRCELDPASGGYMLLDALQGSLGSVRMVVADYDETEYVELLLGGSGFDRATAAPAGVAEFPASGDRVRLLRPPTPRTTRTTITFDDGATVEVEARWVAGLKALFLRGADTLVTYPNAVIDVAPGQALADAPPVVHETVRGLLRFTADRRPPGTSVHAVTGAFGGRVMAHARNDGKPTEVMVKAVPAPGVMFRVGQQTVWAAGGVPVADLVVRVAATGAVRYPTRTLELGAGGLNVYPLRRASGTKLVLEGGDGEHHRFNAVSGRLHVAWQAPGSTRQYTVVTGSGERHPVRVRADSTVPKTAPLASRARKAPRSRVGRASRVLPTPADPDKLETVCRCDAVSNFDDLQSYARVTASCQVSAEEAIIHKNDVSRRTETCECFANGAFAATPCSYGAVDECPGAFGGVTHQTVTEVYLRVTEEGGDDSHKAAPRVEPPESTVVEERTEHGSCRKYDRTTIQGPSVFGTNTSSNIKPNAEITLNNLKEGRAYGTYSTFTEVRSVYKHSSDCVSIFSPFGIPTGDGRINYNTYYAHNFLNVTKHIVQIGEEVVIEPEARVFDKTGFLDNALGFFKTEFVVEDDSDDDPLIGFATLKVDDATGFVHIRETDDGDNHFIGKFDGYVTTTLRDEAEAAAVGGARQNVRLEVAYMEMITYEAGQNLLAKAGSVTEFTPDDPKLATDDIALAPPQGFGTEYPRVKVWRFDSRDDTIPDYVKVDATNGKLTVTPAREDYDDESDNVVEFSVHVDLVAYEPESTDVVVNDRSSFIAHVKLTLTEPDPVEPDTGTGDEPDTGTGDEPDTGTGDEPDTGTGDEPDTGTGDEPDTGTGDEPDTGNEPDPVEPDQPEPSPTPTPTPTPVVAGGARDVEAAASTHVNAKGYAGLSMAGAGAACVGGAVFAFMSGA